MYVIVWKDQTTFGPFDKLEHAHKWVQKTFFSKHSEALSMLMHRAGMTVHAVEKPDGYVAYQNEVLPLVWVEHTAFGKTKKVQGRLWETSRYVIGETKHHWVERGEDYYGLRRGQPACIIERDRWLTAERIDE